MLFEDETLPEFGFDGSVNVLSEVKSSDVTYNSFSSEDSTDSDSLFFTSELFFVLAGRGSFDSSAACAFSYDSVKFSERKLNSFDFLLLLLSTFSIFTCFSD